MPELKEGDVAPDFTLPRSGGGDVSLHTLRGHNIILYFYPKDDTPGCTREACGFRDVHGDLTSRDTVVIGISPDTVARHDSFVQKYDLPFALLADPDHAVADAYGVWQEQNRYGKKYMGIARTTFLIDRDGTVQKIWRKVKADVHAGEVLAALGAA